VSAGDSNPYPAGTPDAAEVLHDAVAAPRWVDADLPSPEQVEIYRRMTPGRRLEIAEQMYWSARELKGAWLRSQHPDWTEEQVDQEVTRLFSHATS